MDVLYARCAGLDVHKETVVACARVVREGRVETEVRTFRTTTAGLLELSDWLTAHGCTHVAMESTGVYWKPVWHVLADDFELVLANAGHVRNVPGRKSDVNDAMWLADLLAHGLLRGSFVPPPAVQELRDLTRVGKQLVRALGQHVQRIEKVGTASSGPPISTGATRPSSPSVWPDGSNTWVTRCTSMWQRPDVARPTRQRPVVS